MSSTTDKINGLAFFGKITASVSHELNNVLSIINEYSGLLDDLMFASESGKTVETERIKKIAQNIAEQIKREKDIIKLLNRFAHRVDSRIANFNLYDLAEDIIKLSKRFAALRKVNLEATFPETQTNVTSNPFVLQQIIFYIIDLQLDFCASGNTITVNINKDSIYEVIQFESQGSTLNEDNTEKIEIIRDLCSSLECKVEIQRISNENQLIILFIPISISDKSF